MNHSTNKESGLCWYQHGTNKKWTNNLTDHLMVALETLIALAYMTCIVDLDAYELHLGMEETSTTLLMNARVFIHKASMALQIITEWRIRSRLKCKHVNC
jgi:hypothetical protein